MTVEIKPKNVKDWQAAFYREQQARVSLQHKCDRYRKERNNNATIAKERKAKFNQLNTKYQRMRLAVGVSLVLLFFVSIEAVRSDSKPIEEQKKVSTEVEFDQTDFVAEYSDGLIKVDYTTPSYILGSVHLANGETRCSGTIISKGEEWAAAVSAAHCFSGRIGGKFTIYYPDGSEAEATLLAMDKEHDISLFKVPASSVLGHSWVPHKGMIPKVGSYSAVGYPATRGPEYKNVKLWRTNENRGTIWMYRKMDNTRFGGGDSGGGIFKNGALLTVISTCEKNSSRYDNKELRGCSHDCLVDFLTRNEQQLRGCGPWGCPPGPQYENHRRRPPGWRPEPNIPIRPPRRERRQQTPPQEQYQEPPQNVPPDEYYDEPLPPEGAPDIPEDAPPPPLDDPENDFPQQLPPQQAPPQGQQGGTTIQVLQSQVIKVNSDLQSWVQQFIALNGKVDALSTRVDNIKEGAKGERGLSGEDGEDGKDGEDGEQGPTGPGFVRVWVEENQVFYETTEGDVVNAGPIDCVCEGDDEELKSRLDALEQAIENLSEVQPTPVEDKRTHFVLVADPEAEYWNSLERRYNEARDDFSTKLVLRPAIEIEGELPALALYKEGIPVKAWRGRDSVFQRLLDIAQGHAKKLID